MADRNLEEIEYQVLSKIFLSQSFRDDLFDAIKQRGNKTVEEVLDEKGFSDVNKKFVTDLKKLPVSQFEDCVNLDDADAILANVTGMDPQW